MEFRFIVDWPLIINFIRTMPLDRDKSCIEYTPRQSQPIRYKYFVIDSQTDEEYISMATQGQLHPFSQLGGVDKKRNVQQNQQTIFDWQIQDAQMELQKIQKECELLQKILGDIIQEKANLIVKSNRQRRNNVDQQSKSTIKQCPVHAQQYKSANYNINSLEQSSHNTKTLILTNNPPNCALQKLQSFKTKQMSRIAEQENTTPKMKVKQHASTRKNSAYSNGKGTSAKKGRI